MDQNQNLRVELLKKPTETYPEKNDIFQIRYCALPNENELAQGQILVQNLYLSVDAAQRIWISGQKTYTDPVLPGDIMKGLGIYKVLHSKSQKFKVNDIVLGSTFWARYIILSDQQGTKIGQTQIEELQAMGMINFSINGLTAYFGLRNVGQPKEGETLVVSAAAGGVGEFVVQLAKHYYKCKVIAIAGDEAKCKRVKEVLGADACINYKKENVKEKLKQYAPDGIDIYFDNVGGEILDDALSEITMNSRIILCGAVSQYNKSRNEIYRIKNYPRLIIKKAVMQGFLILDYPEQTQEGLKVLSELQRNGKLNLSFDIQNGLDEGPKGLQRLLQGKNTGKVVIRVDRASPNAKL